MQKLTSVYCEQIGQGGNWKVEDVYLNSPFSSCISAYNNIVFKIPLTGDGTKIAKSLEKYAFLKSINAPVPLFFEEVELDGIHGIATNNLNANKKEILYVSPNTARKMALTKDEKNIHTLLNSLSSEANQNENYTNAIFGKAEYELSNNKLQTIKNLTWVKHKLFDLASNCARNEICLSEDSVFFSVDIKNSKIDDVIIADFDCILLKQQVNIENNLKNLFRALLEFIQWFCEKNAIPEKEKSQIETLVNTKTI